MRVILFCSLLILQYESFEELPARGTCIQPFNQSSNHSFFPTGFT
ncbi:MAG: hypothetical protein Q7S39_05600 [Ignavibacteria bacterium]|nr:hypothetical protein [Ignavibacteria bacterium]